MPAEGFDAPTESPLYAKMEGNNAKVYNIDLNNGNTIKVNGAFVAIGHIPNTEWFRNVIMIDDQGYIIHAPDT